MRALTLSRLPRAQEGRRWHREVVAYGEQLLCLCRSVARTLRDKPRTPVAICGMQAGGASRGPNLPHGRREALHNAAHGMCAGRTPTGQRRMAVPRTEGDVTMKVRQRLAVDSRAARVVCCCTALHHLRWRSGNVGMEAPHSRLLQHVPRARACEISGTNDLPALLSVWGVPGSVIGHRPTPSGLTNRAANLRGADLAKSQEFVIPPQPTAGATSLLPTVSAAVFGLWRSRRTS